MEEVSNNKIPLSAHYESFTLDTTMSADNSYLVITQDQLEGKDSCEKTIQKRSFFYTGILILLIGYNSFKLLYTLLASSNQAEGQYSWLFIVWSMSQLICFTYAMHVKRSTRDSTRQNGISWLFLGMSFFNILALALLVIVVFVMSRIAGLFAPEACQDDNCPLFEEVINAFSGIYAIVIIGDILLPLLAYCFGRNIKFSGDKSQELVRSQNVNFQSIVL